MFAPIAIAAFLFVAIVVAGLRAFDRLDRAAPSKRVPNPTAYTGPLFSKHGREIRA
ncbi:MULTISPECIES: hypothetical protein [unclassified Sphingopyxis]|uniref:hypothetical protein n=1 Tax=unclassified Sphingopyxis TaxID=2614943 RepID=UPI0028566CED|nr:MULTISPECIES: hypothetical protein [unclassified Sphingopyxis]MDR7061199.1 hypothetical protein [Sphingopyxis sp. BE235]MDR7182070.1 hypothetical protein [Sphingopyxis sp. BE249]